MSVQKPIPQKKPPNAPFWEGASEGVLRLQCCGACNHVLYPPSDLCPNCLSSDLQWREMSGLGRVWAHVVFHHLYHPAFQEELPYAVVAVKLDEGPVLISNLEGVPPEAIQTDMRVRAVFQTVADGVGIPRFQPVKS